MWVTPDQEAAIERLAASTDLSVSVYLRTLGLGYEPKSTIDAQHIGDLVKLGGDMGRLGGLLKMWLIDRPGRGAPEADVRRLLQQMGDLRGEIADKVALIRSLAKVASIDR